ncbi:MAG: AMP-binding protein [Lentisphaeria bacterium]|nr:AMP-binding protein [Lentisphaeria bacterium]MBQ8754477.1 AMP-binding protein [Lentisphaeria bacterium]
MTNLQLFIVAASAFFLLLSLHLYRRPEQVLKLIVWVMRHTLMRIKITGQENIPQTGPVLLISNHVSLFDLLLLQAASRRPLRFMMNEKVFNVLPFRRLLRGLGLMVVPPPRQTKAMQAFLEHCQNELRKGEILCLLPEGGISGSGGLLRFRGDFRPFIPAGCQVTVVPVRIGILMGRMLTFADGTFHFKRPRKIPIDYNIRVGKPVAPTLTPFQLRQKISELGAEAEMSPQPREVPLHTRFLLWAKLLPCRTIFIDADGGGITNFKLLRKSLELAELLRKQDCGNSGYIGVCLPNSIELVKVLLSILFSDHTPAVLNFTAGEKVAIAAAKRAGVNRIVTSRAFIEKMNWEIIPEMLFLEDIAVSRFLKFKVLLQTVLLPRHTLARTVSPLSAYNVQREAVLLFSSGSTGVPKAVMLRHRNINSDIFSLWRVLDWRPDDRICGNLPIFHSFGLFMTFAFPIHSGSPVVFAKNPLEAQLIVNAIEKYKITILASTPTFLASYIRKAKPEQFKTLRLTITGAEKLRPQLTEKYRQFTGREIVEAYGCTELSPVVSLNLSNSIFKLGLHADHPGSIGTPLPGVHVRVIDQETGLELQENQPGRLQVKGGLVMKGYLNDPEQTAKVLQFGYYDTGDIGMIDEHGYIYITGRASRFSKIGGEMVPHESIEECIARIRNSTERDVAVSGRPDDKRGERLVVFYTADDLDVQELIAAMRAEKLPNLWIPKSDDFVKIDKIPHLGSGKLDLKALKELADKLN